MKTKNIIIISSVFFSLIFLTIISKAQDQMDFEEFMGVMSGSATDAQLDELSYQLPWDIKVYGYAHGDFSGDGREDIIVSVREKDVTPANSVDVYVFENVEDSTYRLVSKQNFKYYELTLEVAFMVRDGICYITHKDSNNWCFTGYIINQDDELAQVSEDVYPLDPEKAGK